MQANRRLAQIGLRVTGPAPFNGNIKIIAGGQLNATGADSAGARSIKAVPLKQAD